MVSEERPEGLRERKKRATRHALFEAAVRLAAEHGIDQVTVEMISERAGVSARTFFNYFKNRDEVFVMSDPDVGERIRAAVVAAPGDQSLLDVLREAIVHELRDIVLNKDVGPLVAQVFASSPELTSRVLSLQAREEERFAAVFAERLGAQGRSGPRVEIYARLLAAVTGTAARVAVTHWQENDTAVPLADTFTLVYDQLAAGLSGPLDD
ncbi:helix-turn-helix domain-containing protein [Streptomyces sp. NPDC001941]|uniref:TetR/AcrR family transcriptional regulator n=1 Tax=Streptomyces sp. NPDC001941 TaxID=3154659 RepID=UPI003324C890